MQSVHTCTISKDSADAGTAWCWGNDLFGACGMGQTVLYPTLVLSPTQIIGPVTKWKTLSAGTYHTCGISDDAATEGQVYCWGWNYDDRLGHSPSSDVIGTPTPVDVSGTNVPQTWKDVYVMDRSTCALSPLNKLWCW